MAVRVFLVVLTALVAAGPQVAGAQPMASVSGTVTDSATSQPVANAAVVLESPRVTKQGRSGADGKFTIAEVPAGPYHLLTRAEGYVPSRTEITVAAAATGSVQTADVTLDPGLHFSEVASVSPDKKDQFESFQAV